jgi:hypothetical protein
MRFLVCFCLISALLASDAVAQHNRNGGRRGGDYRSQDPEQRAAMLDGFLRQMDRNGDGMITADEATGPQRQFFDRIMSRAGMEVNFPVSISELQQKIKEGNRDSNGTTAPSDRPSSVAGGTSPSPGLSGPGKPAAPAPGMTPVSAGSGPPGGVAKPISPSAPAAGSTTVPSDPRGAPVSEPVASPAASTPATASESRPPQRKSGRFLTPAERLPQGLPKWFTDRDSDGDGQVTMTEFAREWTREKAAEFARADLNHDGIITAAECLKAEKPSR